MLSEMTGAQLKKQLKDEMRKLLVEHTEAFANVIEEIARGRSGEHGKGLREAAFILREVAKSIASGDDT